MKECIDLLRMAGVTPDQWAKYAHARWGHSIVVKIDNYVVTAAKLIHHKGIPEELNGWVVVCTVGTDGNYCDCEQCIFHDKVLVAAQVYDELDRLAYELAILHNN